MALTFTPDGRQMWVPDNIAPMGQQDLMAPPPFMFGQAPQQAPTPAPQFVPPPPPPEVAPPPPVLPAGVGGVPLFAPADLGALQAGQAPAGTVAPPAPPALSKKEQAAQAKAQAQQAAAIASPEGQIAQGVAGQRQAMGAEADIARAAGDVEAEELAAAVGLEREGRDSRDRVSEQMARQQEQYNIAREEHQQSVNKAISTEANYKIDENRRWKDMGTGKTVLFWIGAALSGLGDAISGKAGPNRVIEMMQGAIERDVDLQLKEREQLGKRISGARNSLDDYVRISGGDLKDARAMKLAEEYERHASKMRESAARYGSDKAKLRGETAAVHFDGLAEQLKASAGESMFNRDLHREQAANQRQQTAISGGHLALAKKKQAFDEKTTQKQLDIEAAKLEQAGNSRGAEDVRKYGVPLPPQAVVDDDGKPTGELAPGGTMVLTNANEKEAEATRTKVINTNRAVQLIDELRQLAHQSSGVGRKVSGWLGSPEQKSMSVLKEELVGLLKSGTTGMSSDADAVRLEKRAGVNSLNDLRGAIEALNEAREQTLKGLHAEIRGRGGDPSRFTYADPVANKPTTSAEDVAFGESLKETPLARMPSQLIEEGKPGAGSPYSIDLAARAEYKETGITKGQRKAVQDSVQIANDPTKSRSQRDAALSRLSVGAESAQSPGLRDLYQAALMSAQTSAIRPAPEEL